MSADDATGKQRRSTARYNRARQSRRLRVTEDYLILINSLVRERGEARVVDLARELGVTMPTVTNTIDRLQRDGFVSRAPYRPISLTGKGMKAGEDARKRQRVIVAFLLAMGVDEETAKKDAAGIAHRVSDLTLDVLRTFVQGAYEGHSRQIRQFNK